ncbi:unnamed protein product [Mytilus coruscus]|uniref:C1q domain-containing protein n=1 Tax=Mytilus coruscus TaxID=42192 RepID=A0A6J8ET99_MYTCO|nr:unnamed protein product [Mytilus coruscus]
MFVLLVVCLAISYAFCDISVAQESEISFLKDKFLQMQTIVTKQENRIAYLEETVLRQNTEILNLNVEVSRLRPKIRTLEQSLYSLKNILRRKTSPNPRNMVKCVTKPDIKQDHVPNSVHRREIGKGKRILLQGTPTVNSPIGFYAFLSQNENNPGIHHTIIFDVKMTNVGDGYNSFSGMFTAPKDGLYAFAVSIIMIHEYASYELVKNNAVQGSLFVDAEHSGEWRSSSMTVVLSMFHGDVVFVRTSSSFTPHGSVHSSEDGRSSFAGWLIQ